MRTVLLLHRRTAGSPENLWFPKQHSQHYLKRMPNQVIKITKGRVRFRRFVDKVKSLMTSAAGWIDKQREAKRLWSQAPDKVIRIRKASNGQVESDYGDEMARPLGWSKESPGTSGWAEAKSLGPDLCKGGIWLTAPPDGVTVPHRPFIEGRVADPGARVWVVIHPMEVSDYWVQPPVSVREDGSWRVQVYVGQPGMIDVGKSFELMAFGNPRRRLREAVILGWWPEAEWQSQMIEIVRG